MERIRCIGWELSAVIDPPLLALGTALIGAQCHPLPALPVVAIAVPAITIPMVAVPMIVTVPVAVTMTVIPITRGFHDHLVMAMVRIILAAGHYGNADTRQYCDSDCFNHYAPR